MYYLVTSLTANRGFSKARHVVQPRIREIQDQLARCSDELTFSGVIIGLVDEPAGYVTEIPNSDNVFQLNVGYEYDRTYLRTDGGAALWQCLEAIRCAIDRMPTSDGQRARLSECYERFVHECKRPDG